MATLVALRGVYRTVSGTSHVLNAVSGSSVSSQTSSDRHQQHHHHHPRKQHETCGGHQRRHHQQQQQRNYHRYQHHQHQQHLRQQIRMQSSGPGFVGAGGTVGQCPHVNPLTIAGGGGGGSGGGNQTASEQTPDFLRQQYVRLKQVVSEMVPPTTCQAQSASSIFANNELSLASVQVYGFDYDYTLAFYSNELHAKIFTTALDILLSEYKYPEELRSYKYLPGFAIRGLHYDVQKALLMKIDAFHYIQPGTVYRGLSAVSDEEVRMLYDGTHVPLDQMSDFYGKGSTMKQFMDIFSLPEMMLLSCVNDYFLSNNIDYDPVHLYKDVTDSVKDVHTRGVMYKLIEKDLERYILHGKETHDILHKLSASGKKLFLITNSPFSFVDKGMRYMVGKDWRDLFDVVIVKADKPSFFNDKRKPFRRLDAQGGLQWDRITALHKGEVYKQGNLYEFMRLTGWVGSHVLYFGDHIYSDLADGLDQASVHRDPVHSASTAGAAASASSSDAVTSAVPPLLYLLLRQDLTLRHGWRTGAIIPELRDEINTINSAEYTRQLTWLQALTGLIDRMQVYRSPECHAVVQEWDRERQELRTVTKSLFNPQFGSLFRTHQNPTYFNRRLSRFADVYMTCVSCLLNYDLQHTFFPRRAPLQHEAPLWLDQLCIGCLGLPGGAVLAESADAAVAAGAAARQERR